MSRFAILLGGDVVRTPRLDAALAGTRVLAADSGMRHAARLGIEPELWVGDFDSVSQAEIARHGAVAREVFPPDKDQTDGELAIEAALARGATALVLVGAFGGPRADHAFLHMTAAIRLAERGVATMLTSGVEEGHPLLAGAEAHYDYAPGTLFSILAFSGLSGLSVKGAKWPLDDVEIAFGSSLTLSNEVAGPLRLCLDTGRAMLLAHPQSTKAD
ncbi:thiamine diphosphokinase [Nitratireductor sp. CAU 1489]|uniref:Thiamine diphosphokinase n=1 Tax=Nitratireductor arenosus TaxID=2682096 RepID=A0A844QCQ5_9HYPH|nr:thiamine diphosphokinase [Nitratireductor arenosus]MVA96404.1 thiamine diphosphokinase [Nitratireductor arenosus]